MFSLFLKLFLMFGVLNNRDEPEDYKKLSDEELILRFKRGDRKSFSEIFRRYKNMIFNFVIYFTGNSEKAEDITQETFVRVFSFLKRYGKIKRFKPFLYKTARNLCFDSVKRSAKGSHLSLDESLGVVAHTGSSPHSELDKKDLKKAILKAVSNLSDEQRQVFILKEINGYKFREIAEILNLNENTVKSRLRYALLALRKELFEYYHGR